MPGSEIMLASSTLLLRSDTVIDASGMRLAVTTVSVSLSDACAWTERGDALRRATGLPYNSPLATTQSSAFFSTPGTPCAYSGLEIKTPSLDRKSTRLNSSHTVISYAVFCLKKKKKNNINVIIQYTNSHENYSRK